MNTKTRMKALPIAGMIIISILIFSSCSKPAGYGGSSTITGSIVTRSFNSDYSRLINQYPAVDEDVFLLFGDSEVVGDKTATGPEGNFSFEYLRPGSYKLYFLSEDSTTMDRNEVVVMMDIELEAGESLDLGKLIEYNTLDFDEGNAKISGIIKLINYKNTSQYPFLEVKDTSLAQEYEVYIAYENQKFYDDRIRTSYDGYFEFSNLLPGNYKVFTYSEDVTGGTEDVVKIKEVSISGSEEEIDLGIIFVEQL